ncbi:PREDICTED: phosphonopyruvate decarboxylase-like [Priapulus caudatus]|uniref:Phosphonopyruvate decarboxylase-like n=1 Tax=Priapulus caudatus TaxID=37621 RepID=A0ABM1EZ62_PRICU|nr:PREDICTED: phosphonopyruvate decarboxylase-like [Priapulus caudatus]
MPAPDDPLLVRDFLDPARFIEAVRSIGVEFFCGVPDSLLKDFCAYVTSKVARSNHVITCNEGSAVALAAGYHIATGRHGLVYMQNSGLGNAINPLLSLASTGVYSVPMLLLVGWRGEPGKRDEPQHAVQGHVTPGLLASLGIPFQPLPDYHEGAVQALEMARQHMISAKGPYCLLVKRQTFLPFRLQRQQTSFALTREAALPAVIDALRGDEVCVSTNGMLSRELFEYRARRGQPHSRDFYTVGSMGHIATIALGIALFHANKHVICLDGDGSVIMHMGALATVGQRDLPNLKHVVFNNGAHDSTGAQPTDAANHDGFSFPRIAEACGYRETLVARTEEEVRESVGKMRAARGPVMLEVKCRVGARKDLGRPTCTPTQNKADLMHYLHAAN